MPATGCHIICNWILRFQNRHDYISLRRRKRTRFSSFTLRRFCFLFRGIWRYTIDFHVSCIHVQHARAATCLPMPYQRLNSKSVSKADTMTGFAGMCKSPRWFPSRFSLTMVRNHRSIRPLQDTVGAMEYSNRETNAQMSRL